MRFTTPATILARNSLLLPAALRRLVLRPLVQPCSSRSFGSGENKDAATGTKSLEQKGDARENDMKVNPYYYNDEGTGVGKVDTAIGKLASKKSVINLDVLPILEQIANYGKAGSKDPPKEKSAGADNKEGKKDKRKNRFMDKNIMKNAIVEPKPTDKPIITRQLVMNVKKPMKISKETQPKPKPKPDVPQEAEPAPKKVIKSTKEGVKKILNKKANKDQERRAALSGDPKASAHLSERKVTKPLKKLDSGLAKKSAAEKSSPRTHQTGRPKTERRAVTSSQLRTNVSSNAKPKNESVRSASSSQSKKKAKKKLFGAEQPKTVKIRQSAFTGPPEIEYAAEEHPLIQQFAPRVMGRNICLLTQRLRGPEQTSCLYQIVEKVPILGRGKENELRQLSFKDLLVPEVEPINIRLSMTEMTRALGEGKIDSAKLINMDIPRMQIEIREAIKKGEFDFAANQLAYMLNFNGMYNKAGRQGYRANDPIANILKLAMGGVRDEQTADPSKVMAGVEALVQERHIGSEYEENVPFRKLGRRDIDKHITSYLKTPLFGFALVKYKSEELAEDAFNSMSKYVGVTTPYGTMWPTTAYFCNYIYLGTPQFAALNSYECATVLRKLMADRAERFVYSLAVPQPLLPKGKGRVVDSSGVVQIRYRSFDETLQAYEAFAKSRMFEVVEFVSPRYSYYDGYHSSPEERANFARYDFRDETMLRIQCDPSIANALPEKKQLSLDKKAEEKVADEDKGDDDVGDRNDAESRMFMPYDYS